MSDEVPRRALVKALREFAVSLRDRWVGPAESAALAIEQIALSVEIRGRLSVTVISPGNPLPPVDERDS